MGIISAFSGSGTGTLADPYQITNCTQLQETKNALTANYTLMNNIDCSDTINWNNGSGFLPISSASPTFIPFSGVFNGDNYNITNLYIHTIQSSSGTGLFGYSEGIIKNTNLVNVNISGNYTIIGSLAGYNKGIINNCSSILGKVLGGNASTLVGGLVGLSAFANTALIIDSFSSNYVTGYSYVGGLAGYNYGIIERSFSTGNVTGLGLSGGSEIAGLAGRNWQGTINNSYATGNVSGAGIGGLVSECYNCYIDNSYSTGTLFKTSSGGFSGGLVGFWNTGGNVTNSFWDVNTSNKTTSAGGVGKNTTQMKTITTFQTAGWNIVSVISNNSIWGIDALTNNGYPYLQEFIPIILTDTTPPIISFEIPTPSNTSSTSSPVNIVANVSDASDTSAWIDMDRSLKKYLEFDYYNSTGIFDNSTYDGLVNFNGTLTSLNIVNGTRGKALSLNGSDYLNLGNLSLSTYSISFWINPRTATGTIIGSDETTGYRIYLNNGILYIENSALGTTANITLNNWTHIVIKEDNLGTYIYVNGALNNYNTQHPETSSPTTVNIALGRYNKVSYLNASIDELLIFNRSLDLTEIKALNNSRINKINSTFTYLSSYNSTYWTYAVDSAGNLAKTYRGYLVGVIQLPIINIISPVNYQSFESNATIQFNLTETYATNCWYSNNSGVTNHTYTCGQNFTIKENTDGGYNTIIWANNSDGLTREIIYYFVVPPPAVNLNSPADNFWLNNNVVYFYFTPTDSDGISQCSLYDNRSGTWDKRYSWDNPTSSVMQSTSFTLSDATNIVWNVLCNDTLNNQNWAVNNKSFNLDATYPSNTISDIPTSAGSQFVSFTTVINDTNAYSCRYSVYNLAGGIDGANYNVPFNCINGSFYVSSFAGYILKTYVLDIAGNENLTTRNFMVSSQPIQPPPQGGDGGQPITTVGNWTMETELSGSSYQFNMIQGSSRSRDLLFENLGTTSRIIKLTCEPVSGSENLCNTLTFAETTFPLPLQRGIKTAVGFTVIIPEGYEKGNYVVNLIATDEEQNKGIITLTVTVASYASITGALTKLFSSTTSGIPYFILFLVIAFISGFIIYFTILKPNKLPSAIAVIAGLLIGIIFLLLPI